MIGTVRVDLPAARRLLCWYGAFALARAPAARPHLPVAAAHGSAVPGVRADDRGVRRAPRTGAARRDAAPARPGHRRCGARRGRHDRRGRSVRRAGPGPCRGRTRGAARRDRSRQGRAPSRPTAAAPAAHPAASASAGDAPLSQATSTPASNASPAPVASTTVTAGATACAAVRSGPPSSRPSAPGADRDRPHPPQHRRGAAERAQLVGVGQEQVDAPHVVEEGRRATRCGEGGRDLRVHGRGDARRRGRRPARLAPRPATRRRAARSRRGAGGRTRRRRAGRPGRGGRPHPGRTAACGPRDRQRPPAAADAAPALRRTGSRRAGRHRAGSRRARSRRLRCGRAGWDASRRPRAGRGATPPCRSRPPGRP